MAVPPSRVVQGLPPLKWRGLVAHCEDASFSFSHTQVERGAYGIDAAWHDHARRNPIQFKCTLHFVNTMFGAAKSSTRQYPDNYNKWQEALFDGSAGKLHHPMLGEINARAMDGEVTLVAQNQAGVSVRASFVETIVDITREVDYENPQVNIKDLAAAVAKDASKYKINFPRGILDKSLEDAIDSFLGNIHAFQMTASGYATQIVGKLDKMISQVEAVADPSIMPLHTNLVHLWDAMRTRAQQAEKAAGRSTSRLVMVTDSTLDKVAADFKNSMSEIMELNPHLISRPVVPKGALVTYYTDK